VGNGDAEAADVTKRCKEALHVVHQQGQVHGVDAGGCKGCIVQRGAAAVHHWIAHHAKHLQASCCSTQDDVLGHKGQGNMAGA
jgi:hypothetical protein